jgi:hypothetical protein
MQQIDQNRVVGRGWQRYGLKSAQGMINSKGREHSPQGQAESNNGWEEDCYMPRPRVSKEARAEGCQRLNTVRERAQDRGPKGGLNKW